MEEVKSEEREPISLDILGQGVADAALCGEVVEATKRKAARKEHALKVANDKVVAAARKRRKATRQMKRRIRAATKGKRVSKASSNRRGSTRGPKKVGNGLTKIAIERLGK